MNFCVDCKHSVGGAENARLMKCAHPLNEVDFTDTVTYLVTGIPQPARKVLRAATCTAMRMPRDDETLKTVCGPDAVWFVPRET